MNPLDKIWPLLNTLLLPELTQDLDSTPIEREQFESYHENLQTYLPILYDCIQQEPNNFIWSGETNEFGKQEVQVYLILLLCEISYPNSIFSINRIELTSNAKEILQSTTYLTKEVDDLILKYYEDKLHKDSWKRQLGAVHGFVEYLEFRYSNVCNLDKKMSQKRIMFSLSVALNIRSCYESYYKTLSTSVFILMLRQGDRNDIIPLNIHGVISDALFKDIYIMDSKCFVVQHWNCLIKCLDFYETFDSFTWNLLDDMMEVLLRNISLSPDSSTSICFLKFASKLVVYFTIDRKEFENFFEKDLSLAENVNDCRRTLANANTSYTCYRWAKCILQMFILESHKLMQAKKIANQILQEIHKVYILAILPIPLSIVEPHLTIFLDKFIAVLMETLKVHKYQEDLISVITSLLETFFSHLQSSEESSRLYKFRENIYQLLKTDIFEKYSTI